MNHQDKFVELVHTQWQTTKGIIQDNALITKYKINQLNEYGIKNLRILPFASDQTRIVTKQKEAFILNRCCISYSNLVDRALDLRYGFNSGLTGGNPLKNLAYEN